MLKGFFFSEVTQELKMLTHCTLKTMEICHSISYEMWLKTVNEETRRYQLKCSKRHTKVNCIFLIVIETNAVILSYIFQKGCR